MIIFSIFEYDDGRGKASQVEKYQMVIDASTGKIRFDEIKLWLQSKTIQVP
jgi:hypothetical protein